MPYYTSRDKRGVVIFGVVSLTMGNSVFPFGDRRLGDAEKIRKLLLGGFTFPPQAGDIFG